MLNRIIRTFLPCSALASLLLLQACGSTNSDSSPTPNADASTEAEAEAEVCKVQDCPKSTDDCKVAACVAGACTFVAVADGKLTASGQATGDCRKRVCKDGKAQIIADDTDFSNDNDPCTTDVCQNGQNVHSPTGGTCNTNGGKVCGDANGSLAGKCVQCNVDADCTSPKVCDPSHKTGLCVAPTCVDGQKNGDESSVDCGGSCSPCDNGDSCNVAQDCQSGVCSSSHKCIACAQDTDCSDQTFCDTATKVCTPDKPTASECTSASQCASGFCADGFCCDTECNGICNACSSALKGEGENGQCGAIAAGSDPQDECEQEPEASCGKTGMCDGAGACSLHANTTVCLAASCSAGTAQPVQTCDGLGTCTVQAPVSCGGLVCNALGTECLTTCVSDADCVEGDYCTAGQCTPKLTNGIACTAANQCAQGNCVDGFCCDTACEGTCSACSAEKKGQGADGLCGPVVASSDPDDDCSKESEESCGRTGMCDGAGSCALYNQATSCVTASCSAGVAQPARNCSGLGTCVEAATVSCGPLVCDGEGKACLTSCSSDSHCAPGNYCINTQCQPTLNTGAACSAANQCASGNCVDGVCCNTACQGLCSACSAAKKGAGVDGECSPIMAEVDPDNECADQGAGSCGTKGTCNGAGACGLYPGGTTCGTTTCSAGTVQPAPSCNGSGVCVAGAPVSCGGMACNAQGTACLSGCAADTDCVSGNYCVGGKCMPKQANGLSCSGANQCASAACVDGFCCNAFCGNTCTACNIPGKLGTCSLIPNNTDPANECAGVTNCNGAGACALLANGSSCTSAGECSGGFCFGSPPVCHSNGCGNGVVGVGESCDDGNSAAGDGCSASCWLEADYSCTGSPSVCTYTSACPKAIEGPHPLGGYNWYLGVVGQSCTATCAAKGLTYDEATSTYAGSSGSKANCSAVSIAFGRQPDSSSYGWSCAAGWGCSYHKAFQTVTWCSSPATNATANDTNNIMCRLCACK